MIDANLPAGRGLPYTPTDHPFYCQAENGALAGNHPWRQLRYDNWAEFKNEFIPSDGEYDDDYNYVIRFDLCKRERDHGAPLPGLKLHLFMLYQGKGMFVPVVVELITEDEMPEVDAFLRARWEYHLNLWPEFSQQPTLGNGGSAV